MQLGMSLCAILAINTYSAAMPIVRILYASICVQAWLQLCMVEQRTKSPRYISLKKLHGNHSVHRLGCSYYYIITFLWTPYQVLICQFAIHCG